MGRPATPTTVNSVDKDRQQIMDRKFDVRLLYFCMHNTRKTCSFACIQRRINRKRLSRSVCDNDRCDCDVTIVVQLAGHDGSRDGRQSPILIEGCRSLGGLYRQQRSSARVPMLYSPLSLSTYGGRGHLQVALLVACGWSALCQRHPKN